MSGLQQWQRFCQYWCSVDEVGVSVDVSRMGIDDDWLAKQREALNHALDQMEALEAGAIANPDEDRMVGHYWLRAPDLAPDPDIRQEIEDCQTKILRFVLDVHSGEIKPTHAERFTRVLLVGIGGSALGPQFVNEALRQNGDPLSISFFDNTDPDGMDQVLGDIGSELKSTLTLVVSKSGGTKETRNGMLEAAHAYEREGLEFARHAVAVTSDGSALSKVAEEEQWLEQFPMWDWVGGRTSVMSAVGLLPAALQGFDIEAFLTGARIMDAATRERDLQKNPAALMVMSWLHAAQVDKLTDMVVIPYKDRLALFARYLQQLIMESLGKELDLDGKVVHQGIAVYGNKGSTDQHAYVQQLREGLHNFHATFVQVLRDRQGRSIDVESHTTSGDFLNGFLLGTRDALTEKGRGSITITLEAVSARSVGALIALYERIVGLYAALVNINAYHQPGVEAGKKAAGEVLKLQTRVLDALENAGGHAKTADQIAEQLGEPDAAEWVFRICEHLAAQAVRGVTRVSGRNPADARFATTSETA